ncbi:MAG: hypothetical protein MNPFHGCM_02180 [Gemmatimonadaceae bacterium]|nr:hypothetical protein [Gemmatimonadaceae bacterium]
MSDLTIEQLTIRELVTLDEYQACVAFQDETWGHGFSERVPAAILRVGQKLGGVSAGAFEPTGRMAGFVFGLTGIMDGSLVHWSDMLAVAPDWRNRQLGERLKHYQAERVRALGVRTMMWTFDPLVARNAHFNINRLRAFPSEYIPDMYGANTGSTLHGAIPTDRFVISWDLERALSVPPGDPAPAVGDAALPLLNPLDASGAPSCVTTEREPTVRVQVPADSQAITTASTELAARWRYAVRSCVVPLMRDGYRVARFVRGRGDTLPYYVFTRDSAPLPLPPT